MTTERTLTEARFHPNLPLYRYLRGVITLVGSVVGLPLLPVWLIAGWYWSRRYFETYECELGERTLSIAYGIWFRTEKSIPLEQIQDLSVRHGPLLNWLGLTKLTVETAGQGSTQQAAGSLVGVQEPLAFRDRVLEQRRRLAERGSGTATAAAEEGGRVVDLLEEIRDTLARIEERGKTGAAADEDSG